MGDIKNKVFHINRDIKAGAHICITEVFSARYIRKINKRVSDYILITSQRWFQTVVGQNKRMISCLKFHHFSLERRYIFVHVWNKNIKINFYEICIQISLLSCNNNLEIWLDTIQWWTIVSQCLRFSVICSCIASAGKSYLMKKRWKCADLKNIGCAC